MTVALTFSWASEPPDGFLKRIARHYPQSFRFSRSGWSLRISVPNRFSSDAHAVSWGPYFETLVAGCYLGSWRTVCGRNSFSHSVDEMGYETQFVGGKRAVSRLL